MNRRGEDLVLSRIIQLVIVGILFGVTLLLISQNDGATGYFMDFYMHDMHLITELVIASPGDLSFTYDNIRTDLPLTYSFGNVVRVGVEGLGVNRSVGLYPNFRVAERSFESPFFIAWTKTQAVLDVRPMRNVFESCDRVQTIREVTVSLELLKDGSAQKIDALQAGVARPLTNDGLPFVEEANLRFIIEDVAGRKGVAVTYSTDLLDGEYIGCLLEQQIRDRTGYDVTSSPGNNLGEDKIEIRIRIVRGEELGDDLLGQIIGQVIEVYRG